MDNITTANILLYETEEGKVNVSVYYANETFWLMQKAMAELFDVQISAISKHLKNIFLEGDLDEKVVVSKMEITTQHGALEGTRQAMSSRLL